MCSACKWSHNWRPDWCLRYSPVVKYVCDDTFESMAQEKAIVSASFLSFISFCIFFFFFFYIQSKALCYMAAGQPVSLTLAC